MSSSASGQQSSTSTPAPPASYRARTIVLGVPPAGGSVPADKPVVVFRFSPGEGDDLIDPSSFRLWVDGQDRSSLFQLGNSEAWGRLAPDSASKGNGTPESGGGAYARGAAAPAISPGVHLVSARICSMRGVCETLSAPVMVQPPIALSVLGTPTAAGAKSPPDSASGAAHRSGLRRLVDLAIVAARKLLAP